MKVLLVHLSDGHKGGGGGIAMLRLHLALQKAGIDSRVLCRTKTSDSPYITEIPRMPRVEAIVQKLTSRLGLNDIHLVGSSRVKKEDAYKQADVIDFQGIHTRTLSYLALPSLTKNKPTVFTMHDMWAFTGHCAYSYDCDRWKSGCGKCPYPRVHPAIRRDNTHLEWWLKKNVYSRSNLTFVAASKWVFDRAKESILASFPIYCIPNGIDTETFRPLDPMECRAKLGIPARKKVLMFSALKLDNYRKGGDLLVKVLQGLRSSLKSETVLLTIGEGGEKLAETVGMETINLGYVKDDERKAMAYSAADLFLFPTRADIFGLVSIESLACGTPVVSFRIGGVPESVIPGSTGYLAEPEDVDDFRSGILQLLEDEKRRKSLGEQGAMLVTRNYRHAVTVQRYIYLYEQLLHNQEVRTENDLVSPP